MSFYYWPWFVDVEAIVLFICFPVVCFLGARFRPVFILALFYAIACYCVDLYQLYPIGSSDEHTLIGQWVIWSLILVIGCVVACILKLAVMFTGAAAAAVLANMIYQLVLSSGLQDFLYARLIVIGIFAIVGAVLALTLLSVVFKVCTPIVGGFFCVLAVDHFGYFMGWWVLQPFFPRIEPYGQFFSATDQFPWGDPKHVWGLLVLWVVLALSGMCVQFRHGRHKHKEEARPGEQP